MIDLFRVAWSDLVSQPVRTLASISGLLVAVLAALLVTSAALLSERANHEYINDTYGRVATVRVIQQGSEFHPETAEAFDSLLQSAGVERFSWDAPVSGALVVGDNVYPADASMVSSSFPSVSSIEIIAGVFPKETTGGASLRLVVSHALVVSMGLTPAEAVGMSIQFAPGSEVDKMDLRTSPSYSAVIEAVATRIGPESDARGAVIVTDSWLPQLAPTSPAIWLIHIASSDVVYVEEVVRTFNRTSLASGLKLESTRVDVADLFRPMLDQQRSTASVVFAIVLLLGGFGIAGIGVTTVRERRQELGVRRSFGATSSRIFLLVMIQTMMDVVIALVLAFPMANLSIRLFAREMIIPSLPLPGDLSVPIPAIVITVTATLLIGFLAGLLPALMASRTSVIQALSE